MSLPEAKRFRLLIIGKTGCGKTTILSKVCGEDVADQPSAERGVHDIERELLFKQNDKLVAHDSEGFEAGQNNEFEVVNSFIGRREAMDDINQQLHMVWYCMEMSSRQVQHAERQFFSTKRKVPVVAVITKFDVFIQDIQQELEQAAEDKEEEIDDDEIEAEAIKLAEERFNEYYRTQLESLPFPPRAIVTLSHTHESKPDDSRLGELVRQTMVALTSSSDDDEEMTTERREQQQMLRDLFVTAQTADLTFKVELAVVRCMATGYAKLGQLPVDRKEMINFWNTVWSSGQDPEGYHWLDRQLQEHIDNSARIIGHQQSHDIAQVRQWSKQLQMAAQLEEIVIDSVIIMKHIFLLHAEQRAVVQGLIEWYDERSQTAKQIRKLLVEKHNRNPYASTGLDPQGLYTIINSLELEVPEINMAARNAVPRHTPFLSKLFKRLGKKHK